MCESEDADSDEWSVERLKHELNRLLSVAGIQLLDLVREWDQSGDGQISRKEMLMHMKRIVNNEAIWYSKVRPAVKEAFDEINTDEPYGRNATISLVEFCKWLDPPVETRRRSALDAAGARGLPD